MAYELRKTETELEHAIMEGQIYRAIVEADAFPEGMDPDRREVWKHTMLLHKTEKERNAREKAEKGEQTEDKAQLLQEWKMSTVAENRILHEENKKLKRGLQGAKEIKGRSRLESIDIAEVGRKKLGPNMTWSEKWGREGHITYSTEKVDEYKMTAGEHAAKWKRNGRIYEHIGCLREEEDREMVVEISGRPGFMESQSLIFEQGTRYGIKNYTEEEIASKIEEHKNGIKEGMSKLRELEIKRKMEQGSEEEEGILEDMLDTKEEVDKHMLHRHQFFVMLEEAEMKELNSDDYEDALRCYQEQEEDFSQPITTLEEDTPMEGGTAKECMN